MPYKEYPIISTLTTQLVLRKKEIMRRLERLMEVQLLQYLKEIHKHLSNKHEGFRSVTSIIKYFLLQSELQHSFYPQLNDRRMLMVSGLKNNSPCLI